MNSYQKLKRKCDYLESQVRLFKEALERIKSKYKGCLVKEAHNLPFSSDINIENIEEYWHIENKNDFSQIEKDLEMLDIIKFLIKKGDIVVNPDLFIDYPELYEWLEQNE